MSNYETTTASAQSTSTGSYQNDGDELHSLQTYVSDLLALEEHIGKPLDTQLAAEETAQYGDALAVIQELKTKNESHVQALRSCLEQLGGHEASPIKSAWANLLGGAAAGIGASRKTKVTKWLRDDYTALSLASMSYTLLHATAVGLNNPTVAQLAKTGLADYASAVININEAVPEVVLGELRDDGIQVQTGAADTIRQQTQDIWRRQGQAHHQEQTGIGASGSTGYATSGSTQGSSGTNGGI